MAGVVDRKSRLERALEEQLPESGFPAGVGVPSAIALVLLTALAILSWLLLGVQDSGPVPDAVTKSQQELVDGTGQAIGGAISQNVGDLRAVTAVPAVTPNDLLARLAKLRKWRGAVVMNARTRTLLASIGDQVPVELLPRSFADTTVIPVASTDGTALAVTAIALPGDQVLAVTRGVSLPDVALGSDLHQALLLTTATGEIVDSHGKRPGPPEVAATGLVRRASVDAAAGRREAIFGVPVQRAGGTEHAVVTYTPVRLNSLGAFGLSVVGIAYVPAAGPATDGDGLVLGIVLSGVAIVGFLLIRGTLVLPTKRLRADALRIAGGNLTLPVRQARMPELRRVGAGFEHCRRTMTGISAAPHRRLHALSARLTVILVSVSVLGWSVGVVLTTGGQDALAPASVVTSIRDLAASSAAAAQHGLNDGLADLKAITTFTDGLTSEAVQPVLERVHEAQPRYRSVYLAGKDGAVERYAGRAPLRTLTPPPPGAGVRQHFDHGRVAVLYAHVPLSAGRALIAEFDTDWLVELLGRTPAKTRLLDAGLRTLAATGGYVAFEQPSEAIVRRVVEDARAGESAARVVDRFDGTAVVTAIALRTGATGEHAWSVVAEYAVDDLALAANKMRRNALVVAFVAVLLALLVFGWHHLVLVRPLRALAAQADGLVAGDHSTVLYPQRHDQIGTIASCLEISRQGLADGIDRLGPIRGPQATALETTELIHRTDDSPATPAMDQIEVTQP
ncbi:hypothetical protein [Amycolatopsis sp. NPDC049868]|uniref:hypothetical protein n=1 Tax=Amycolatopsis sp. NPDC049868 TaxID=3363934 RepID=UPI0037A17747